jgi:hypothetical protein
MELLKILTLIVQMGMPITFPEGDQSLQQPLADKIEVICKDEKYPEASKLHEIKNNPKFKKTKSSIFTKDNTKDLYIFLTHIDSTYLYLEDCDYSLLKFLRYKTTRQSLQYKVVDSMTYSVNEEKLRLVRWYNGIGMKIFENNTVFETTIDTYSEYWECGNKLDYSPKYPYTYPKRTPLRINYTDEQNENLGYILKNPIMVFSIMPLNEMTYDLPYNLEASSRKEELETSSGKDIEGTGIDLDNDKILDAFWFNEVQDSSVIEVITRLYINIEGKWIPMWYTYFREM